MKITIIPHQGGEVKYVRVPTVVIIIIIGMIFGGIFYGKRGKSVGFSVRKEMKKVRKLEEEVKRVENKYEKIKKKLTHLLSIVTTGKSVQCKEEREKAEKLTLDLLLIKLEEGRAVLSKVKKKLTKFYPNLPTIPPVEGYIVQGFGEVNYIFTQDKRICQGLDFLAPLNSPVYATGGGKVKYVGKRLYKGLTVEINHGMGIITQYSHLGKVKVKVGEFVKRGEVIGEVGNSGKTIGSILHYEVWKEGKAVEPRNFMLGEVRYF